MSPLKIQHVVSFSSQDPQHPVENLLSGAHPWLSCPQERSQLLKVELQLEQANHIGFVDIGNCGSAFLQIDVGRSSWPLDQPFVTLLPTTTLMTPVDSKLGKNRTGVKMFKKGDFLSEAMAEKWDRVRVTCSQPFNKRTQFGLSFLRFYTPPVESEDEDTATPAGPSQIEDELATGENSVRSWLSSPPIRRTFFSENEMNGTDDLKSRLLQMDPNSSPLLGSQRCLSRTARMVISAAHSGRRSFPTKRSARSGSPPSATIVRPENGTAVEGQEAGTSQEAVDTSVESTLPPPARRGKLTLRRKRVPGRPIATGRSFLTTSPWSRPRLWGRGRHRRWGYMSSFKRPTTIHFPQEGALGCVEDDEEEDEEEYDRSECGECGNCPICGGCFRMDFLPIHASTCGERVCPHGVPLMSSDEESTPEEILSGDSSPGPSTGWVPCPLCGLQFSASAIELHASACAEEMDSEEGQSPCLWVE